MAKLKTLSEAETARRRAVTGLYNLGLDEDADRIDDLTAREYAEEKNWEVVENPKRRKLSMATLTQLKKRIADLEEENEELQERLDSISEIVSGEEEEEEEEGD